MFTDLIEKIGDFLSDGVNSHDGQNDFVPCFGHSDFDLSMYSADEIKEAMNAALDDGGIEEHSSNYGHDIAFGAAPDVDARNLAKSTLLSKLSTNHIYTSNLHTDKLWGGLDSYSGDKVYDAINSARDSNKITESVHRELITLLKKACHSQ